MKWEHKIQECRECLSEEKPQHLHIRRQAIVTDFIEDFNSNLKDYYVIEVNISEWNQGNIFETLRAELQKNSSKWGYFLSRINSLGASLPLVGGGFSIGFEEKPDYIRINDCLENVVEEETKPVLVVIRYFGERPIDGFGWINKLDIPEQVTVITDGYTDSNIDTTTEVEIGRFTKQETVDYVLTEIDGVDDENIAEEIHSTHDGNPFAIEIANEQGNIGSSHRS